MGGSMDKRKYYRVFLKRGKTHKNWPEWYAAIYGELGAPVVDYASDNLRVVKTSMTSDELLEFCSLSDDGKSFAKDVEIQEITRKNGHDPLVVGCIQTIQRYYKDFTDVTFE
jgi:hypothetical protein